MEPSTGGAAAQQLPSTQEGLWLLQPGQVEAASGLGLRVNPWKGAAG